MANAHSGDDYSLSRVPMDARRPMWEVLVIRIGSLACVSQLMLGAALGYGMTFWGAFWATMLGSVLLQVVSYALGAAAAREGLSTSLLSRWAGFGKIGSSMIGGVIAIALMGWFGVQNSVFADGLLKATGMFNLQVWALITGLVVTVIVAFGFRLLSLTANISLPLFLIAVGIAMFQVMSGHNVGELIGAQPAGKPLSLAVGTTMVAGGFILGAVITPDISRFMRSEKDVFWMTLIGTFAGELGMNLMAVLMSLAVRSGDIVTIMLSLAGWIGAAIVIFSTLKMNDLNLYSSTLGITNMLNALFQWRVNRVTATWVLGIVGTVLSMLGILNYFVNFLVLLGVAVPPVAGIMFVDYYILKRNRSILDETRARGTLPEECEIWNPVTMAAWLLGFLVGYFVTDTGIPAINSLVVGGLGYYLGMKLYGAATSQRSVEFAKTNQVV
ncbi:permease for cytosine/purines uracil thiamine allantoin [Desulfotomaculum nigrificans CO-1-SRB]|uniref:Permease for cytosine/purines uracil thiamine allantoin n=1 Tax=Desulfotomaculum nigrificans (strain DSM 14880 / VKM B-2319 / CO-1-SRB) TaxID=868595 RepID=F6B4V3_DESCC|nr:cytosine permease [Desulfotomaculum nigrificans]AEF95325.1 permease for cytosine/purines uracil thiamine allantoin [Desulfotomaculum nigrificans CO-1-SRB]